MTTRTFMFGEQTFELLVEYTAKWTHGSREEFHGIHDIGQGYELEIDAVYIELGGERVNIKPQLTDKQIRLIEQNIDVTT